MKQTLSALLVLGLLAAGLSARAVRAQEPLEAPDEPGLMAELGDDMADAGPMMAHDGMGMGPGAMEHRGRWGRRMHGGGFGPAMARELDLTTDQREKMRAAHDRQARKAIQARADIQLARMDLHKLMQADKPDARAIDAQIDKIAGLRTALAKSRVATMLEVRAVLTPAQQQKLRELHERGPQQRQNHGRQGGDM